MDDVFEYVMMKIAGESSGILDTDEQFEKIKDNATKGIKNIFPIIGEKHKLVLNNAWINDNAESDDFKAQKDAKLKEKTFGIPLYGDVSLIDNETGKEINRSKQVKLMELPKMTTRGTFIVKGNEWNLPTQFRLKPGVYTVEQANGLPKTQINLGKGGRGKKMELHMSPTTGEINMQVENSIIPLLPTLRALGISDKEIKNSWGDELFEINNKKFSGKEQLNVKKFAQKWLGESLSSEEAVEAIKKQFSETELDKEVTNITLRKPYASLDESLLLDASKKLIDVQTGKEETDDRDHLRFKTAHSVDDFFRERLEKNQKSITFRLKRSIDSKEKVRDILAVPVIKKMSEGLFTQMAISERSEQHNPIHIINEQFKTTLMGEGALGNLQMVKDEARSLHPSHLGILDPVKTPESAKIGVINYLTLGSQKVGNDLMSRYVDHKRKKLVHLPPIKSHELKIAFPDQYKVGPGNEVIWNDANIKVQHKGKVELVKPEEVDLVIPSAQAMFTFATAMIPFLDSLQGGRSFLASKHTEQTVSLIDPEVPQVMSSFTGGKTIEDSVGEAFAAVSPVSGTVDKITDDYIRIKEDSGETTKIPIYNHFKLNDKSFFHHKPLVNVGDKVKKDGLIADLNFTKNGKLSLGRNARVAYMSESGATLEDGIIVSESFANKMIHQQMHEESSPKSDNFIYSKDQFGVQFPGKITTEQANKLDDRGIIKKGSNVVYGDVIFAAMRKTEDNSEDRILRKLGKGLVKPLKEQVVRWEKEVPGVVTDVTETNRSHKVQIKASKPLEVGDKLAGRHGNKGVVSQIKPDGEMPVISRTGEPVEVILNPIGVVGRTNPSQILETVVSKVADITGKSIYIENFKPVNNHEEVIKLLEQHGLKETEELIDPKTNKKIGDITEGNQYIIKLVKTSESGFSARPTGAGYDLNRQPITGGEEGSKSLDALTNWGLVSHGANNILREMATYKSEQSDDFWRAIQLGQMLPGPKVPFVWDKFKAMLQVAGVNVDKKGSLQMIIPTKDSDILAMSAGELTDPKMLRGKGLKEHKGGLFDPELTGGVKGNKWTHISLAEPIPNPIFKDPIKKLTGVNDSQFNNIIGGEYYVGSNGQIITDPRKAYAEDLLSASGLMPSDVKIKDSDSEETKKEKILNVILKPEFENFATGGNGIKNLLKTVDLNKKKEELESLVQHKKGSEKNSAHRALRYVKSLEKQNRRPEESYMTSLIPVMPPQFRPIYQLESGDMGVAEVNYLYRDLGLVTNQLRDAADLDDDLKKDLRKSVYKGYEALVGISGAKALTRPAKGIISTIAGDNPKTGFFQSKLLRKQQDLASRGVIVPDPSLEIDEVGIPKKMAKQLFRPFTMNKLIKSFGLSAVEAHNRIKKDKDEIVDKALLEVMRERPVLLNRAPSLHKYSIQAFQPKIVPGKAIRIPNLVIKGFNADFDGDSYLGRTLLYICVDMDIDFWNNYISNDYNQVIANIKERLSMPHLTKIPVNTILDMEHFPRIEESVSIKSNTVLEYDVPKGVMIPSVDSEGSWSMKSVTKYSIHLKCEEWITKTLNGRELITSSNHSLCVLNPETLEISKCKPVDAIGLCIPVLGDIQKSNMRKAYAINTKKHYSSSEQSNSLSSCINEDFSTGWFFGAYLGDGWFSGNQTYLAYGNGGEEVVDEWINIVKKISPESQITSRSLPHSWEGKEYISNRVAVSGIQLSRFIEEKCGKNDSKNKRLPNDFLNMTKEFRRGLFCGLIDTDGTVNSDKNKRFNFSFTTKSQELATGIVLLGLSLGLYSGTTEYEHRGTPTYLVTFSNRLIHDSDWITLTHTKKNNALIEYQLNKPPEYGRNNFVPMPVKASIEIEAILRKMGATKKKRTEPKEIAGASIYAILRRKQQYITRITLNNLVNLIDGIKISDYLAKWLKIVTNESTNWDIIISTEPTGEIKTMYDITVPETWTFISENGLAIWDSMNIHIPVSAGAVDDANKIKPSNMMRSPATIGDDVVSNYLPQDMSQFGLYLMSSPEDGNTVRKAYASAADIRDDIDKDVIKYNDTITFNGKKTTAGNVLINDEVPEKYRDYDSVWDKKKVNKLSLDLTKEDGKKASHVINRLRLLGEKTSFNQTLTMNDIKPMISPEKDKIFKKIDNLSMDNSLNRLEKSEKILDIVSSELAPLVDKFGEKNSNMYKWQKAGAINRLGQIRQQLLGPTIVADYSDVPIPVPIKKSFSEGLSVSEYFTHQYGARKGMIGRALETAAPGYQNKLILSAVGDQLIDNEDCGDKEGVEMKLDDGNIVDRYEIKTDVLITPEIIAERKANGEKIARVRSPLTCRRPRGICAKCYGLNENGKLYSQGTNIGAIAGQSVGEPLTQAAMKAFHTGGVFWDSSIVKQKQKGLSVLDEIKQMTYLPQNFKQKATLALNDGEVSDIKVAPGGGYNIMIGTTLHHITPGQEVSISIGDNIKKGQPISSGIQDPNEILSLRGMRDAQTYMVDSLLGAYGKKSLKKKNFEVMVRGATDSSIITNPGDNVDLAVGDIIPFTLANDINLHPNAEMIAEDAIGFILDQDIPGKAKGEVLSENDLSQITGQTIKVKRDKIKHEPTLLGIRAVPQLKGDWLSALGQEQIQRTITEGTAKGLTSNIHGSNPIAAFVYGKEFGKGPKGRY